jgi:hypothetical protein
MFVYWINERESIRKKKEAGLPKPWSDDPVFQETYFCNVRREDDRVTRWLRANWLVDDKNYEFAMVMARLINRPESLKKIGYPDTIFWDCGGLENVHYAARTLKPFWGNAYVVTTHGQRMDKLEYLLNVLQAASKVLPMVGLPPTCQAYHSAFKTLEGFGDFMAAQVVADLKNTCFHPLAKATDWWGFVAPGPGSIRGMQWYFSGPVRNFKDGIDRIRHDIAGKLEINICNQDLQNCLCEFDKYMRVKFGTGRSKRKYNGRHN